MTYVAIAAIFVLIVLLLDAALENPKASPNPSVRE
jgi:hypothetical protein